MPAIIRLIAHKKFLIGGDVCMSTATELIARLAAEPHNQSVIRSKYQSL